MLGINTNLDEKVINDNAGTHGIHLSYETKNALFQNAEAPVLKVDLTSFLLFAPRMESYYNFNDLPCGMAFVDANASNSPNTNYRYLCITFTASNGYYIRQIAYSDSSTDIYSRMYDKAKTSWGSWVAI